MSAKPPGEYRQVETTSPQLEGKGGVFCMNVDIAEVVTNFSLEGTSQILKGVLPWAVDPELAEKLWEISETMTGSRFEL